MRGIYLVTRLETLKNEYVYKLYTRAIMLSEKIFGEEIFEKYFRQRDSFVTIKIVVLGNLKGRNATKRFITQCVQDYETARHN